MVSIVNFKTYDEIASFEKKEIMFRRIAEELKEKIDRLPAGKKFYLAVSGGSTPNPLYQLLDEEYKDIDWSRIVLFWVDERMVPWDDEQSNYGTAIKLLPGIPSSNIHRIIGENDPVLEEKRYQDELLKALPSRDGIPVFRLDMAWVRK
jgi:6-phosphogluconolactonase